MGGCFSENASCKYLDSFIDEKIIYEQEPFMIQDEDLLRSLQHRLIGGVRFLTKQLRCSAGSGILISKSLFFTAAHNIYDKMQNSENSNFKFYIGVNGPTQQFYQAQSWRYPTQFKTAPNDMRRLEFDYALIKLKINNQHPINYETFPKLAVPCQICLQERNAQVNIEIFGYPLFKQNYKSLDKYGEKIILQQYGLARKSRIVAIQPDKSKISYAISTLPGHSGSPIFAEDSMIAIHNGGGVKAQKFNIGRPLTFPLLGKLKQWQQQLKADPFTLNQSNLCPHLQALRLIFESKDAHKIPQEIKKTLAKTTSDQRLEINEKSLIAIDTTHHLNLLQLNLDENNLQAIDISQNKLLAKLSIMKNHLKAIDIGNNINLRQIDLYSNKLKAIGLKNNINLTQLSVACNQLATIDLRTNTQLVYLNLSSNKIEKIDLTAAEKLTQLWLYDNRLTDIDLKTNINITQLWLYTNRLKNIDLRYNTNILWLSIKNNKLQKGIVWFGQSKSISFEGQDSSFCEVTLLHDGQYQECKKWGESQMQRLNNSEKDRDPNRYNCKYSLRTGKSK